MRILQSILLTLAFLLFLPVSTSYAIEVKHAPSSTDDRTSPIVTLEEFTLESLKSKAFLETLAQNKDKQSVIIKEKKEIVTKKINELTAKSTPTPEEKKALTSYTNLSDQLDALTPERITQLSRNVNIQETTKTALNGISIQSGNKEITPEMVLEANRISQMSPEAQAAVKSNFQNNYGVSLDQVKSIANTSITSTTITDSNGEQKTIKTVGDALVLQQQAITSSDIVLGDALKEAQFNKAYMEQTNMQIEVGAIPGFNGDIFAFFNKVIRASVNVAMTLAVFMLVLAGFAAVQAKDSAKEEYFKKVTNVATGIFVILLSYLIVTGVFALLYNI